MYYVIKKQSEKPQEHFIGFRVPKYIASKNNDSVIFEFLKDGKPLRKWVKKEEIILLTDDKEYFLKVLNQFKAIEEQEKALVNEAQAQLEQSLENFSQKMNETIDAYEVERAEDDVPCILKYL